MVDNRVSIVEVYQYLHYCIFYTLTLLLLLAEERDKYEETEYDQEDFEEGSTCLLYLESAIYRSQE